MSWPTVVSDLDRRRAIDVLDGRDRRTVERWLSALPAEVCGGIAVVSIDPYDAYRYAIRAALPRRRGRPGLPASLSMPSTSASSSEPPLKARIWLESTIPATSGGAWPRSGAAATRGAGAHHDKYRRALSHRGVKPSVTPAGGDRPGRRPPSVATGATPASATARSSSNSTLTPSSPTGVSSCTTR